MSCQKTDSYGYIIIIPNLLSNNSFVIEIGAFCKSSCMADGLLENNVLIELILPLFIMCRIFVLSILPYSIFNQKFMN